MTVKKRLVIPINMREINEFMNTLFVLAYTFHFNIIRILDRLFFDLSFFFYLFFLPTEHNDSKDADTL